MATTLKITDRDLLEAWLKTRSRQDCMIVAHRAALRVLPIANAEIVSVWAMEVDPSLLALLRCNFIADISAEIGPVDAESAKRAVSTVLNLAHASYSARGSLGSIEQTADRSYRAAAHAILSSADMAHLNLVVVNKTEKRGAAEASASSSKYAGGAAYSILSTEGTEAGKSHRALWHEINKDAERLADGQNPLFTPLWFQERPAWFDEQDINMQSIWDRDPAARWQFWRRWWEGVKAGRSIKPKLKSAVLNGIDENSWDDPDDVAARISAIEMEFGDRELNFEEFGEVSRQSSSDSSNAVQRTAQVMVRRRRELPPTLDAISGFVSLEIERLQTTNSLYETDDGAAEAKRQIAVLMTIDETVDSLSALVPNSDQISRIDAEKAESLLQLYFQKFAEWPRVRIHNQNMTTAAKAHADRKTFGHLS